MVHPAFPRVTKPIPWLQHLVVFSLFFISFIAFIVWFSLLPVPLSPAVVKPRLELSLSGAIGTNIILDAEETANTLSCEPNRIRFLLPATELYGLSWTFELPTLTRASTFTLGSTYPLTLSLVSQAGAYRTFTASEGELSFDLESKRGYFTAFLYDGNGERVFASAAWQCP